MTTHTPAAPAPAASTLPTTTTIKAEDGFFVSVRRSPTLGTLFISVHNATLVNAVSVDIELPPVIAMEVARALRLQTECLVDTLAADVAADLYAEVRP